MPSTGRKLAGAVGFVWLAGAVVVTVSAIVSRSWSLVVPAVLVPTAVGGLLYETFHSLKALQRSRATAATVGTVCLMVASVVVAVFEIREITTYDDPPPSEPVPSYYVPELPTPSAPPTRIPFPSNETWDPLRP